MPTPRWTRKSHKQGAEAKQSASQSLPNKQKPYKPRQQVAHPCTGQKPAYPTRPERRRHAHRRTEKDRAKHGLNGNTRRRQRHRGRANHNEPGAAPRPADEGRPQKRVGAPEAAAPASAGGERARLHARRGCQGTAGGARSRSHPPPQEASCTSCTKTTKRAERP